MLAAINHKIKTVGQEADSGMLVFLFSLEADHAIIAKLHLAVCYRLS
jgi:hypothetical protein